jgi:hypothetical protein
VAEGNETPSGDAKPVVLLGVRDREKLKEERTTASRHEFKKRLLDGAPRGGELIIKKSTAVSRRTRIVPPNDGVEYANGPLHELKGIANFDDGEVCWLHEGDAVTVTPQKSKKEEPWEGTLIGAVEAMSSVSAFVYAAPYPPDEGNLNLRKVFSLKIPVLVWLLCLCLLIYLVLTFLFTGKE